jgi:hypothetical protein
MYLCTYYLVFLSVRHAAHVMKSEVECGPASAKRFPTPALDCMAYEINTRLFIKEE